MPSSAAKPAPLPPNPLPTPTPISRDERIETLEMRIMEQERLVKVLMAQMGVKWVDTISNG